MRLCNALDEWLVHQHQTRCVCWSALHCVVQRELAPGGPGPGLRPGRKLFLAMSATSYAPQPAIHDFIGLIGGQTYRTSLDMTRRVCSQHQHQHQHPHHQQCSRCRAPGPGARGNCLLPARARGPGCCSRTGLQPPGPGEQTHRFISGVLKRSEEEGRIHLSAP
jgi:hypothetical protein